MAVEVVERRSVPSRIVQFYQEVQDEMRKVTWPDRPQLKDTTIKIIIFVLFIGAVIGLIDLVLPLILVQGMPSLFTGRCSWPPPPTAGTRSRRPPLLSTGAARRFSD